MQLDFVELLFNILFLDFFIVACKKVLSFLKLYVLFVFELEKCFWT